MANTTLLALPFLGMLLIVAKKKTIRVGQRIQPQGPWHGTGNRDSIDNDGCSVQKKIVRSREVVFVEDQTIQDMIKLRVNYLRSMVT